MIRVKVGGVRTTIQIMDQTRADKTARAMVVQAMGATLLHYVRRSANVKDGHDQPALDAMDHPYARRHGAIQESKLGHPGWWVHNQTGRLLNAIRGRTIGSSGYMVFADTALAPHAAQVIQGSRVMFPRDFIWITANNRKVRREMMRSAVRILGKVLRTKAHVRIAPTAMNNEKLP